MARPPVLISIAPVRIARIYQDEQCGAPERPLAGHLSELSCPLDRAMQAVWWESGRCAGGGCPRSSAGLLRSESWGFELLPEAWPADSAGDEPEKGLQISVALHFPGPLLTWRFSN